MPVKEKLFSLMKSSWNWMAKLWSCLHLRKIWTTVLDIPSPLLASGWRPYMGTSVNSHFSQISILLGEVNHKVFPSEEEQNEDEVAIFRSKISQNYVIYGAVNPNIITMTEPINTTNFNIIWINTLSIHNLQEKLLLTVSAEKYSDPSSCENLPRSPRRKGSWRSWTKPLWIK